MLTILFNKNIVLNGFKNKKMPEDTFTVRK